ncbi:imidazole glycerol phosphate synthase subunit HisH [Virgifigura deserti]|uniref:imidazole glycerol phosphate synthase subunit HisH n=1 Tax=Virgifigura deserti TaxID=2268457 RepID=UPI003CCBA58E
MTTIVIDYGSGNLRSAAKALERAAAEAGCGERIAVSADAADVARADRIVLPGVGAFADCRRGLDEVPGLVDALRSAVLDAGRPFLGICVGMQLMATTGREHGDHAGLGWIDGAVVPIDRTGSDGQALKIPHMGWNELTVGREDHPVLTGIASGDHAYFVHSYQFVPADPADRLATVDYGTPLAAVVGRDNLVGTQFHPEKSQATGLRLLANFLQWRP